MRSTLGFLLRSKLCFYLSGNKSAFCRRVSQGFKYMVRPLEPADVSQLVDLGKLMHSTDCVSCLNSWMEADPEGIKIAVTPEGEIVGSCCGVFNGDNDETGLCFGGVFFVQKKYQSQGIGQQLYSSCIKHAGNRNAGLNAVAGQVENYRTKGGFPIHETRFTTLEYHSTSWPLDFTSFNAVPPPGVKITDFHESHLPAIFVYDEKIAGFRRQRNTRLNIMEAGSSTVVALGGGGTIVGYGTVKKTVLGAVRIGPLYADDSEVAEVLLRKLAEIPEAGTGFAFVTTSANSVAKTWMEKLRVGLRDECTRLYIKRVLNPDLSKVYAQFDINFAPI